MALITAHPRISRPGSMASSRKSKRSEVFFDLDRKNAEWEAINARLSSPRSGRTKRPQQALQQKKKLIERTSSSSVDPRPEGGARGPDRARGRGSSVESDVAAAVSRLDKDLQEAELRALFYDADDPRDAILTIHPGAGGTESQAGPRCCSGCTCATPSAGALRPKSSTTSPGKRRAEKRDRPVRRRLRLRQPQPGDRSPPARPHLPLRRRQEAAHVLRRGLRLSRCR